MALRETENNAYAKFLGDKQRALWYVMVFSGVVNTKIWSSTPWFLLVTGYHILLVGIPVLACAREEFAPAHQNGALVRKARCDVTTT